MTIYALRTVQRKNHKNKKLRNSVQRSRYTVWKEIKNEISKAKRKSRNKKKFGVRKQMPYNSEHGLFMQRCRAKGKRKGRRDTL